MGFGFELYSQNGNTLNISKDYFNLSVYKSGLVTSLTLMNSNIGGGKIYRCYFPKNIKNPLPAVQIADGSYATIYDLDVIALADGYFDIWVDVSASSSLKYFLFSFGNVSNKNYGRRIYNPDTQECVFDSCLKYMRIVGVGETSTTVATVAVASLGRSGDYTRTYVGQASGQSEYKDKETFSAYARSGNNIVKKTVTIDYGSVFKSYLLIDGYVSQRGMPSPLMLNVTNF